MQYTLNPIKYRVKNVLKYLIKKKMCAFLLTNNLKLDSRIVNCRKISVNHEKTQLNNDYENSYASNIKILYFPLKIFQKQKNIYIFCRKFLTKENMKIKLCCTN